MIYVYFYFFINIILYYIIFQIVDFDHGKLINKLMLTNILKMIKNNIKLKYKKDDEKYKGHK